MKVEIIYGEQCDVCFIEGRVISIDANWHVTSICQSCLKKLHDKMEAVP